MNMLLVFLIISSSFCSYYTFRFNWKDSHSCDGEPYNAHMYLARNGSCLRTLENGVNDVDYMYIGGADGNLTITKKSAQSDTPHCTGNDSPGYPQHHKIDECSGMAKYRFHESVESLYDEWVSYTWFLLVLRYKNYTDPGEEWCSIPEQPYFETYPFDRCFLGYDNVYYKIYGDHSEVVMRSYQNSDCSTMGSWTVILSSEFVIDGACSGEDHGGFLSEVGRPNMFRFGLVNDHKVCFNVGPHEFAYYTQDFNCEFITEGSAASDTDISNFPVGFIFFIFLMIDSVYAVMLFLCCCFCLIISCFGMTVGEVKKRKRGGLPRYSKFRDEVFDDIEPRDGVGGDGLGEEFDDMGGRDMSFGRPGGVGGAGKGRRGEGVVKDSSGDSSSDGELEEELEEGGGRGGESYDVDMDDMEDIDFDRDPQNRRRKRRRAAPKQHETIDDMNHDGSGVPQLDHSAPNIQDEFTGGRDDLGGGGGDENDFLKSDKIHAKIALTTVRLLNILLKLVKDFRSQNGVVAIIASGCVLCPTYLLLCNTFCFGFFLILTIVSFATDWRTT